MKKLLLTITVSTLLATVVWPTIVGATPALASTPSIPSLDPTSGFVGAGRVALNTAASSSSVVGLWHLDERTGVTAFDSSGNGNNGAISGPVAVSERLGHSTVAFTMDVYAAVIPSMGRAAADAAEQLFG